MAKRTVEFTLVPDSSSPNGYKISGGSNDAILDPVTQEIRVAEGHHYYMTFTLGDHSLSFDGDRDEVFLARAGENCPNRGEVTGNSNFQKKHMKFKTTNGRKQLEIRNNNVDPGTFSYRILIRQGTQILDFDPVIINGGGGQGKVFDWLHLLLGFGTGLVLMGVAYKAGLLAQILG